jgi:Frag1/DRAM/Sfk1 family
VFIICSAVAMGTYLFTLVIYFYYTSPARASPSSSLPSSPSWPGQGQGLSRVNSSPSIYSTDLGISLPPRPARQYSIFIHIALPLLSILFSVIGATNLILLTIFDTARYERAHRILLPTSIAAHILGCLILCIWTMVCLKQYRQPPYSHGVYSGDKFTLELYAPRIPISRGSLVVKTVIVVFEIGLIVLFGVMVWWLKSFDMAAVMEWVVVLLFGGYMLCLVVDLWVASRRMHV